MTKKKIEGIIEAIESGDVGVALNLAKSALETMDKGGEVEEFTSDYLMPELMLDDAQKLVGRAVRFCGSCGRNMALAEFSDRNGKFVDGQQYVFVLDTTGVMLAHGINEKYIGKDFLPTVDFEGRRFISEIVKTANEKGHGWTEYKWINPVSGKDEHKTVYFELCEGMIICSGIYGAW